MEYVNKLKTKKTWRKHFDPENRLNRFTFCRWSGLDDNWSKEDVKQSKEAKWKILKLNKINNVGFQGK